MSGSPGTIIPTVSFFALLASVSATSSKMDFLPYAHVRTDPVTDPSSCGGKPGVSGHVHTYYGAAASLRPSMSYEELRVACGNSGNVDDNKSLYWHPTIYRFDKSTDLYHIEKIYFASAYYVWRTPATGEPRTHAFPPGFQMIARQSSGAKARVKFDCNGPSACERGEKDCTPLHTCPNAKDSCFPTQQCSELEIRIVFPACWDGKRLTSSNFMDHVAYGKGDWSGQEDAYEADCPDTHKFRIPEVHFYFRILDYAGGAYTFSDGTTEVHADYFSGWDEKHLQKVLDQCKNDGQAAMPDQWCEQYLSFRDLPKVNPKEVKDPEGSDGRIVKMLKAIQPKPSLDPRRTVSAEQITGVAALPRGSCSAPLIAADPNTDWRCTRNCSDIGSSSGDRGQTCGRGGAGGDGGGGAGDGGGGAGDGDDDALNR